MVQFPVIVILSVVCVLAKGLSSADIESKIDNLLAKMTFEEKIGQMTQFSGINDAKEEMIRKGQIGSLLNVIGAEEVNCIQRIATEESRLGIPIIFGLDVIHGYRTMFPIPLAASASWDTALVREAAEIAAKEAASEGLNWTFAPMVDIARDPRWGRIAEGAGEDPFLGSAMATAQVKGFQGANLSNSLTLLACAKHYVGYGEAEGGRDYNTTDFSERSLREIYLPPFKAAVDAGVGSLMSAFNDIGGVPATGNVHTLRDILKGEWNFNGFVVSDWNSIGELMNHGIAGSPANAGTIALLAGVDMDMEGRCYSSDLKNRVDQKLVDDAVRRILRIKFKIGLFDHPYIDENLQKDIIRKTEYSEIALKLARESIVLLKNEEKILPLKCNKLKSVAVIGPLADDNDAPLGTWRCQGEREYVTTVLQGLQRKFQDDVTVYYTKGCDIESKKQKGFRKAVSLAAKSDVVIMVMGESADMSGEAASRSNLGLPGVQTDLIKAVAATEKPIVLVLMNGRPLAIADIESDVAAIVESWHLGDQHGNAVADVLVGDYNPSGKLTAGFPRTVGQIPVYYNHKNSGRPGNLDEKYTSKYLDLPLSSMYPFGYGLSYTKFEYSGLTIQHSAIHRNEKLNVTVNVKNSGNTAGTEIVQLYIRDLVGSVTRPVKELKGFRRVNLQPGEEKTVTFAIAAGEFGLYDINLNYVVEAGDFELMVGGNSTDVITGKFKIIE